MLITFYKRKNPSLEKNGPPYERFDATKERKLWQLNAIVLHRYVI